MVILSDLRHPLTGERVELYDPDEHSSAAGLAVTCTHCLRHYVCTPWDDFIDPAPDLGWTSGSVCELCLLKLASLRASRS